MAGHLRLRLRFPQAAARHKHNGLNEVIHSSILMEFDRFLTGIREILMGMGGTSANAVVILWRAEGSEAVHLIITKHPPPHSRVLFTRKLM